MLAVFALKLSGAGQLLTTEVKGHTVAIVISPKNELALLVGHPVQVTEHHILIGSIS